MPRPVEDQRARLLESLHRLQPKDAHTRAAIAALLGLELATDSEDAESLAPGPLAAEVSATVTVAAEATAEVTAALAPPPAPVLRPVSTTSRVVPSHLVRRTAGTSTGSGNLPPQAQPEEPFRSEGTTAVQHSPLFHPAWQRRLLLAALSVPARRRQIDESQLIGRLAQAEPITVIPRRWTTRPGAGVQVILDLDPAMTPFAHDQTQLVTELCRAIGGEQVRVLRCDGDPLERIGDGPRRSWQRYRPPKTGWPVLALTAGATPNPWSRGTHGWAAFFRQAVQDGTPVTVLSPWGDERLSTVPEEIRVVAWDRKTTVADVLRALR